MRPDEICDEVRYPDEWPEPERSVIIPKLEELAELPIGVSYSNYDGAAAAAAEQVTGHVFEGGAYRDGEDLKLDYEGSDSPLVTERYARYLHAHRRQSNGEMRESDNWQQGISRERYARSLHRHFMDWWLIHRGYHVYKERRESGEVTHVRPFGRRGGVLPVGWTEVDLETALCGLLFNVKGYLFEVLLDRDVPDRKAS